jgi:xylan 1,4-beta-xylosidase
VSGDVLQSRRQIAASSMPELELHYTEWSSSYTPSDPIHDSYHQAAYILQKLKQVDGAADSMSYWVFTDIFEEAGPRFTPFHGGFGLLNYQGIRKPAFFAYAMLNRLGATELANDDTASWITRNADGDLQVLFWDFTDTHAGKEVNNQDYYVRDLPARALPEAEIRLAGIPEGRYRLEIRQVGYKVNDPYADYLAMGRPRQLTIAQVDSIKARNDGAPVAVETLTVDASGRFARKQPMRENDVFLYSLTRLGD